MGIITKITDQKNKDRINIFIDGIYAVGLYKYRIKDIENHIGKKIEVGTELEKSELEYANEYIYKIKYSKSWTREQERIEKVKALIKKHVSGLTFEDIGFGTSTDKITLKHPKEKGAPDVCIKSNGKELGFLEVTGKMGCGRVLWLRPDKIEYINNHPEKDIWVAHTCDEEDKIYFIKIKRNKEYFSQEFPVRGGVEKFVPFEFNDAEVTDINGFVDYIRKNWGVK